MNFPVLVTPQASFEGGKEKFSMTVMVPKEDKETIAKIEAEIAKVIEDNKATFGGKKSGIKTPLRDGDEKKEDYPEFDGFMFFNCSTTRRPKIVDRNKEEVLDVVDQCYSGQIVNVSITFFAYNQAGSKGVGAGLNNIQVVGGGERLFDGGGEEFDDLDEE